MIRARGLTKRYGDHIVLDRLDLEVASGERVAVLGLNGAGKTTLIRCLMGLTGFEGTLVVGQCDVGRDPQAARARAGYVPQRSPQLDGTLAETVDFFAQLRGLEEARVAETLARLRLPLAKHGAQPVRTLSGGMLQKLLLALALAADVRVLLLDEPTANLDPRARREFLRALKNVGPETTVLMASHRLADVEAVADRIVVLDRGRSVFDGPVSELWQRAGARSTLWVKVDGRAREAARQLIASQCGAAALTANGAALGVEIEHRTRADLLVELRRTGIDILDFWTDPPSLHQLLERIVAHEEEHR